MPTSSQALRQLRSLEPGDSVLDILQMPAQETLDDLDILQMFNSPSWQPTMSTLTSFQALLSQTTGASIREGDAAHGEYPGMDHFKSEARPSRRLTTSETSQVPPPPARPSTPHSRLLCSYPTPSSDYPQSLDLNTARRNKVVSAASGAPLTLGDLVFRPPVTIDTEHTQFKHAQTKMDVPSHTTASCSEHAEVETIELPAQRADGDKIGHNHGRDQTSQKDSMSVGCNSIKPAPHRHVACSNNTTPPVLMQPPPLPGFYSNGGRRTNPNTGTLKMADPPNGLVGLAESQRSPECTGAWGVLTINRNSGRHEWTLYNRYRPPLVERLGLKGSCKKKSTGVATNAPPSGLWVSPHEKMQRAREQEEKQRQRSSHSILELTLKLGKGIALKNALGVQGEAIRVADAETGLGPYFPFIGAPGREAFVPPGAGYLPVELELPHPYTNERTLPDAEGEVLTSHSVVMPSPCLGPPDSNPAWSDVGSAVLSARGESVVGMVKEECGVRYRGVNCGLERQLTQEKTHSQEGMCGDVKQDTSQQEHTEKGQGEGFLAVAREDADITFTEAGRGIDKQKNKRRLGGIHFSGCGNAYKKSSNPRSRKNSAEKKNSSLRLDLERLTQRTQGGGSYSKRLQRSGVIHSGYFYWSRKTSCANDNSSESGWRELDASGEVVRGGGEEGWVDLPSQDVDRGEERAEERDEAIRCGLPPIRLEVSYDKELQESKEPIELGSISPADVSGRECQPEESTTTPYIRQAERESHENSRGKLADDKQATFRRNHFSQSKLVVPPPFSKAAFRSMLSPPLPLVGTTDVSPTTSSPPLPPIEAFSGTNLLRRFGKGVWRMRKEMPPSDPSMLCFQCNIPGCSHEEVITCLEEAFPGVKVGILQYDPVHLQDYRDPVNGVRFKCMWLFRLSPGSEPSDLQHQSFRLRGQRVNIRRLDNVYAEEQRAYLLWEMLRRGIDPYRGQEGQESDSEEVSPSACNASVYKSSERKGLRRRSRRRDRDMPRPTSVNVVTAAGAHIPNRKLIAPCPTSQPWLPTAQNKIR